jgi:hypothetical protein
MKVEVIKQRIPDLLSDGECWSYFVFDRKTKVRVLYFSDDTGLGNAHYSTEHTEDSEVYESVRSTFNEYPFAEILNFKDIPMDALMALPIGKVLWLKKRMSTSK